MKIMYVTTYDLKEKSNGVSKKINAQINTMIENGIEVTIVDVNTISNKLRYKIMDFLSRFFLTSYTMDSLLKFVIENFNLKEYDSIYIRKVFTTKKQLIFLEKIKNSNPNIKILLEIPTYPYDDEFINTRRRFITIPKDKKSREYLYKFVDRIITYSKDEEIFGIKTIKIMNSVDFKAVSKRSPIKHDGINMISVSFFDVWHGYDRIIKGMLKDAELVKKYNINLLLVGNGKSVKYYKELVKGKEIENNVIFYGKCFGEELNNIYNISDIGIDTLARHRVGVFYNSTLKGKEYLAKGLPIVSGVETDLDPFNFDFYHRVEANDSDIPMSEIINFYRDITEKYYDVSEVIRKKTEDIFDFRVAFKPVIDYLKVK